MRCIDILGMYNKDKHDMQVSDRTHFSNCHEHNYRDRPIGTPQNTTEGQSGCHFSRILPHVLEVVEGEPFYPNEDAILVIFKACNRTNSSLLSFASFILNITTTVVN